MPPFFYALTHQSLPLPYYSPLCPTKNTSLNKGLFRSSPAFRSAHYDAVRRMRATYYSPLYPTKTTSPDLADFSAIPRPPTRALRRSKANAGNVRADKQAAKTGGCGRKGSVNGKAANTEKRQVRNGGKYEVAMLTAIPRFRTDGPCVATRGKTKTRAG